MVAGVHCWLIVDVFEGGWVILCSGMVDHHNHRLKGISSYWATCSPLLVVCPAGPVCIVGQPAREGGRSSEPGSGPSGRNLGEPHFPGTSVRSCGTFKDCDWASVFLEIVKDNCKNGSVDHLCPFECGLPGGFGLAAGYGGIWVNRPAFRSPSFHPPHTPDCPF